MSPMMLVQLIAANFSQEDKKHHKHNSNIIQDKKNILYLAYLIQ